MIKIIAIVLLSLLSFVKAEVKPIPIILFTGQSNIAQPSLDSSSFEGVEIMNGIAASGASTSIVPKSSVTIWGDLATGLREGAGYGSLLTFTKELHADGGIEGFETFAVAQASVGGNTSNGWNPDNKSNYRWQDCERIISRMKAKIRLWGSEYKPFLHTVVINQGEGNAYNTPSFRPWYFDWRDFCVRVNEDHGANVNFIVQSINTENLFARQDDAPVNNSSRYYPHVKRHQTILADKLDYVHLIDTNAIGGRDDRGDLTRDDVHYNEEGHRRLGEITLNKFKELL